MALDNTQQQAAVVTPMLRSFMTLSPVCAGFMQAIRPSRRIYSVALVFYQARSVQPTEQSMPTTSGSAARAGSRTAKARSRPRAARSVTTPIASPAVSRASRFKSGRPDRRRPFGLLHHALSLILGDAKLTAEHMETKADVTLEKVAGRSQVR